MDRKILSHFAVLEAVTTCMDILQRQQDWLEKEGRMELAAAVEKIMDAIMDVYEEAAAGMPDEFWRKDG